MFESPVLKHRQDEGQLLLLLSVSTRGTSGLGTGHCGRTRGMREQRGALDSRHPDEGFDGESDQGNTNIVWGYLITSDTSCHIASFLSSARRLEGGKMLAPF